MRKLFLFLLLAFNLTVYADNPGYGFTIVIDGIKYSGNLGSSYGDVVCVIANDEHPYSDAISIPETISVPIDELGHSKSGKVDQIDINAFKDCTGLTSIFIPSTITEIKGLYDPLHGGNPFAGCTSLEKIQVDENNKYFDSRDNCNALIYKGVEDVLIAGCKNTTIPDKITIGSHAFENCTGLTSLVLNNSISEYAFAGCSGLTNVEIDSYYISGYSFNNCFSLKEIIFKSNVSYISGGAFKGCNSITDVFCYAEKAPSISNEYETYNSPMQIIEVPAFEEMAMNNTTIHVHDYAIESFKNDETWSKFKAIVPFEKVTDFNLVYFVDGEEYKTVQYKYEEEITPEEYPFKEGYTFSGWIEIPAFMPGKDIKVYGTFTKNEIKEDGVIYWAKNKNAIVIGNDNVAGDVNILSSIEFDGKNLPVTDMDDNAFNGCKDITSVEMPATVISIGERTFAGIDKLTDVTIRAEEIPETDRTAFENSYIEDYVTLHVPAGLVEKYKAVAPWKNFKEIVAIEGTEEAKDEDPAKDDEEKDDTTEDLITLKDSGKGTWCSENDLDFTDLEDIKAYIASGYDDIKKTIWLTRVYSVPAGTGIMVKGTPGEHKIPYAKVRAYYANMFKGVVGEAVKIEATDGDWTNYYMAGGQFKIVNGSTTINPNRCYLQLPTLVFAGTRSVDVVYEDEIDDKTGINPSFVTNGQEPAVIYNLQGQRVENPRKGLYIVNGKKVIVR